MEHALHIGNLRTSNQALCEVVGSMRCSRVEQRHRRELFSHTPKQVRALVRSQGGGGAGAVLSVAPRSRETTLSSHLFRVILLRRLRQALRHHRAACAHAGMLSRRGNTLESVLARICREARGRVRTNLMAPNVHDGRRLERVAVARRALHRDVPDSDGHFGSSHFFSNNTLLSCLLRFLFAVFFQSRFSMPCGWHQLPGGWWQQSIRGPRLPSENSRAQPSRQPGSAPRQERSPLQPPPLRHPSRAPEVVVNDAIGEIKSSEAAIDLLGPSSVHAKPLQMALKAAQQKSKVGPIQERLDSCRQFIKRAKKRVLRADEVIARAFEQKAIFEAEVAQAEQRLVVLEAETVATTPAVVPEPTQVKELQTQIDLLVRERDALKSATTRQVGGGEGRAPWMGNGPPCVENIPPMPTVNLQDLDCWMCDRNCDLRNTMEFGDSPLTSKIGGLVGQGAGQVTILSRDVPMDGRSKSSLVSTLIETADAKRRCVVNGIDCASGPSQ